mmetsp:Transcript_7162/g.22920  ORF Transcript_7162/g.22920 Transcript_7162/m.22920 type:complete len:189 (-) Transcript_7162:51-617(-)
MIRKKKRGLNVTQQQESTVTQLNGFEKKKTNSTSSGVATIARTTSPVPTHSSSPSFVYSDKVYCKDWNETGYCGYGDNCRFLHERFAGEGGAPVWAHEHDARRAKRKEVARPSRVPTSVEGCVACGAERPVFPTTFDRCSCVYCEDCAMPRCHKACLRCGVVNKGVMVPVRHSEVDEAENAVTKKAKR